MKATEDTAQQLRQVLYDAWLAVGGDKKTLGPEEIHLEHPAEESHGDYSSNVAMAMFSQIKEQAKDSSKPQNNLTMKQFSNPGELAEAIKGKLEKQKLSFIERISVVNGFINLWLKNEHLVSQARQVLASREGYGEGEQSKGKKYMVEFAHPNTHKEFHIGHLRNICIGEALSRILEANGAEVIRTNYQGDVGLHVAKAVWGVQKRIEEGSTSWRIRIKEIGKLSPPEKARFLGKAYALGAQAYENDEQAKEAIVRLNKQIYEQDPEVLELWQTTRQWSLDYFAWVYQRLGTEYDRLYFESEVAEPGAKNARLLLKKGILEESQGAVVFKGEKYGLDTRVFLTKESLPTYEAKELGLVPLEFSEFGELDRCIHVVAPEQTSFFQVTFKVEELWDSEKYGGKQFHLRYGYVDLKEGKMSSRTGKIVAGMDVVDQVKDKILQVMAESKLSNVNGIAEQVAVGAVKYSLLKQDVYKNIRFDLQESIAMEGDSGPYLQYTFARTQSVLEKASQQGIEIASNFELKSTDFNQEELAILRWLYRFPEVVKQAGAEYAPNVIANFLHELAQRYNAFYNKHRILESSKINKETSQFRLLLTAATGQVVKNGLTLLGIPAPQKM